MALNKLKFNSINVTPSAGKVIQFDSGADGFETADGGGSMKFIKKWGHLPNDDDQTFVKPIFNSNVKTRIKL